MGQMIVGKVVHLLKNGGIRAEVAFPGERITRISEPVAAVSLEKADLDKFTATVLVEVLVPQESGGYLCQQKALEACAILEKDGAVCSQGGCEFLSKGHVFRVPVKATFRGTARANDLVSIPKFTVTTGDLTLYRAVGFSAKQTLSAQGESLYNTGWEVTVEEFFPWGTMDTMAPAEPFELELECMGNIECYENCRWTHRQRIAEEKGIRQFRTAKATGRSITSK